MEIINKIKKEFIYQIDNFNLEEINILVNLINDCNGNIFFCGVGKSGNIAKHCCDLLKCISIKAFYFDILNSTHGDIGTLKNNDLILMISNSGNTPELVNLLPLFKNIGIKTIGICCNDKSKFKELCNLTIVTPFQKEISEDNIKIPTNSCMSHLLFTNILVSILKNNITLDDYRNNHLSGNIGNNLLKIKDLLIKDFPKIIFNNEISLHTIFLKMTKYKIGCCFFINNENELLGLLTDGDIRRLLVKNDKLNKITINDITKNYHYENDLDKMIYEIQNNHNFIPVICNKKLIGIFRI